jgi:hypothetical protein
MDNFNFKQYLTENRVGMYSRVRLTEAALLDAETLAGEIAKQHPELIRYQHDNEARKFQDAIFKYAGEMLQDAGIPLNTVRGLAHDTTWALDLVNGVKDALEHSELEEDDYTDPNDAQSGDTSAMDINEMNPAALGAPQAAADAKMQQQDDENGDMVDNASMDVMAEEPEESIGVVPSVDKVRPAESGIDQYLNKLEHHDWYHAFSDDMRAWNRGQAEKEELKKIYQSLNDVDKQKALDAFKDMYSYIYKPDQFPGAEKNIKYLTTTSFNGFI